MSKLLLVTCLALPQLVLAFHSNPPARRSGVPTDDGGTVCTACHRTFVVPNPDTDGTLTVETSDQYTPGVPQIVKVTIRHPQAVRWGFQLTARTVNDTNDQAGSFTPGADTITRCDGIGGSCEGAHQFIAHSDAPVTAKGEGYTFIFEWTPPANDVGDIMLYFAGNAADNSGTNNGDRIFTNTKRISLSASAGCSNPRPTLNRVVNNASGQDGLSPEMLLTITGAQLQIAGIQRIAGIGNFAGNLYPKEFSCVSVEINGQKAAILSVSDAQLVVQTPWIVDPGPQQVTIIANPGRSNELRSDAGTVMAFTVLPGLYTVDGNFLKARLANGTVIGDPDVIPNARGAKPGEIVLLSGTGFGLTDPVWQTGEVVLSESKVALPFTVTLGDTALDPADVQYLGATAGSISGMQQLRIRIPDSIPDGWIPVKVDIGGVTTPAEGALLLVRR